MPDDANKDAPAAVPVEIDLDRVYANYLRTFAMSGVAPMSRAIGVWLDPEWGEVLSERPEPTTH